VRFRALAVWLLAAIPLPALAADGSRGVLVTSVKPGFALAKAGVHPGDVVLGWELQDPRSGVTRGEIDSPIAFEVAETEYGPRKGLTLLVSRGPQRLRLETPPLNWSAEVQPHFAPQDQVAFDGAAKALAEQKWDEAVRLFRQLAAARTRERRIEDAVWLLESAASARRSQRRFPDARVLTDEALQLARMHRADHAAAWAHFHAGTDLWRKGEPEQAKRHMHASLRIREALAPRSLFTAQALMGISVLTSTLSEFESGRPYAERLLQVTRATAPDSLAEGEAHHQLGNFAFLSDDLQTALTHHRRALQIRARVDPGGYSEARSLGSIANVLSLNGDLRPAQEHYVRALAIFSRLDPGGTMVGQVLVNLGIVAQGRRDLEAAERYQLQALAIFEQTRPNAHEVANIRDWLAEIHILRGDLEAARTLLEEARQHVGRNAPGSILEADVLESLGEVALYQRDYRAAHAHQSANLQILRGLRMRGQRVGEALLLLGRIEAESGDGDAAKAHLEEALKIFQLGAPDGISVAEALTALWLRPGAQPDLPTARAQLTRAAEIARRLTPGTLREAEPLYLLARLERDSGAADAARDLFGQSIRALEAQRTILGGSDEAHALFAERYSPYYLEYIDLLLQQGRTEAAFSVSERYRARALLDAFLLRRDVATAGLSRELTEEHERATWRYEQAFERVRQFDAATGERRFAEEIRALEAARLERNAIDGRVRTARAEESPASLTQSWSASQIRAQLRPDEALLSYLETADGFHLFVIDGAKTNPDAAAATAFRIKGDATTVREDIDALHVLLRAHVATPDAQRVLFDRLTALHTRLIAPATSVLRDKRRLIIVPDGALHRVPWPALAAQPRIAGKPPGALRHLIEDHVVVVAPSATFHVKAQSRAPAPAADSMRVIAFAQPQAVPPLPATVAEVAAIQRVFGARATVLTGSEATETRARELAGSAGILHLAAHAVAIEGAPLDSYIGLARGADTARDNGLLHAWEVMSELRLRSPLVVLSACETAGGREAAGEGLLGLTRAFHYAGARGVVASLWPVSDQATGALMRDFYERIAGGDSAADALRAAQLAMLRTAEPSWLDRLFVTAPPEGQWRHPFFWAGFQLSGATR
jgi:CHAT domain-containing protein/tetratricopeptide (TPR) repeat protein